MTDDDLRDALQKAENARRGYADFDSWPENPERDLGIGHDFAAALSSHFEISLGSLRAMPRGSDPPDLIANESIGIELSELVARRCALRNDPVCDPQMVAAANRRRRSGMRATQYRDWSEKETLNALFRIVERKDAAKLKVQSLWDNYWLVIHTDEPGLTPEMIARYLSTWSPPPCHLITRCFLLMSYFPSYEGRPLFELAVTKAAA